MATVCKSVKLTPAQQKKHKKWKTNVFQQIISSLFDAALDMQKQHNRDHHHCENGNDVSVKTKIDCKIKKFYGQKPLVMHDNIDT